MRFHLHRTRRSRSARGVGRGTAETLSVASQIAMLCPSGMDVWMQRSLADASGQHPNGPAWRR